MAKYNDLCTDIIHSSKLCMSLLENLLCAQAILSCKLMAKLQLI